MIDTRAAGILLERCNVDSNIDRSIVHTTHSTTHPRPRTCFLYTMPVSSGDSSPSASSTARVSSSSFDVASPGPAAPIQDTQKIEPFMTHVHN